MSKEGDLKRLKRLMDIVGNIVESLGDPADCPFCNKGLKYKDHDPEDAAFYCHNCNKWIPIHDAIWDYQKKASK